MIPCDKERIDRIKRKLPEAARKDRECAVFGASSHHYGMNPVLAPAALERWQLERGVPLPEEYARFLLEVGDGGAGPYYGVYALAKATAYTEQTALRRGCVLYPKMTPDAWNRLAGPLLGDADLPDEEYDAARDAVLGGMLCIGTQGCEYDMYLVLEGEHRGRVVYTSGFYEDHPFFFVHEPDFLTWYERWLDEILLDYEMSWFGTKLPGNEQDLIRFYHEAGSREGRLEALGAMMKFRRVSSSTMDFWKKAAGGEQPERLAAIQLICKHSMAAGRDALLELLRSPRNEEFLQALKFINWYGKQSDLGEMTAMILRHMDRVADEETLRLVGNVLDAHKKGSLQDFAPFLCHHDPKMRQAAVYATRNCSDKKKHWKVVAAMLEKGGEEAMYDCVRYWDRLVPHRSLLPYYQAAWPRYRDNGNFRRKFTDCLKRMWLPQDYFEKAGGKP